MLQTPQHFDARPNTLRAFYQWLRRSNSYPVNQPLPTDAIGLERVEEPQALHIEKEDLLILGTRFLLMNQQEYAIALLLLCLVMG